MKNILLTLLVFTLTGYGISQSDQSSSISHPRKKTIEQQRERVSIKNNRTYQEQTRHFAPRNYGKMSRPLFSDLISQIEPPNNEEYDFGDAPDAFYPSLIAHDGARHFMDSRTFLGKTVDGEADGIPTLAANGDDLNGMYDEDGVRFYNPFAVGTSTEIEVSASVKGYLNAWLDFDLNGSWAEPKDHIFINQELNPGTNVLTITIPPGNPTGNTYLRFRFDTGGNLSFTGIAPNGEVEDYKITIHPAENENR
jgi:hypothetical protein